MQIYYYLNIFQLFRDVKGVVVGLVGDEQIYIYYKYIFDVGS